MISVDSALNFKDGATANNLQLEVVVSDPPAPTGRIWVNTDDRVVRYNDGTANRELLPIAENYITTVAGAGGELVITHGLQSTDIQTVSLTQLIAQPFGVSDYGAIGQTYDALKSIVEFTPTTVTLDFGPLTPVVGAFSAWVVARA